MSKIVREVSYAITKHLGPKYIKVPFTEDGVRELTEHFEIAHGIPIEIKQPANSSTDYTKRKQKHSLNVQCVCDYNYQFIDVSGKEVA